MSEDHTNPFAPKAGINYAGPVHAEASEPDGVTGEAVAQQEPVQIAVQEPVSPDVDPSPQGESETANSIPQSDVPRGPAREVLAWVGEDVARAKAALAVETENDNRTGVLNHLHKVIG